VQDERQLIDARRLPPFLDDRLEDARVVGDMASLEPRIYVCGEPVNNATAVEST